MQEQMLESWKKTAIESESKATLSHYQEAKEQWETRQQQIRLATSQFSDQVLKAGNGAWSLFVPDEKYWNVICPVCGCPNHDDEGGLCWSETVEIITDVVLRVFFSHARALLVTSEQRAVW